MKALIERLGALALRLGREWPILMALLALGSLSRIVEHLPTAANWRAKDEAMLEGIGELRKHGRHDEGLALTARFLARRPGSSLLGEAYLLDGRIRSDRLRRAPVPPEGELRAAEESFRRAAEHGVAPALTRQERREIARWLAGRGFYEPAFTVHEELYKDFKEPSELLEGALMAARAAVAGSSGRLADIRYAAQLLDTYDQILRGDRRALALSVPARAAILRLEGRPAEALDVMDLGLVEFNRGPHLPSYYLERGKIRLRLAREAASAEDRRLALQMARRELALAVEHGVPGPLQDEARYQLGESLRLLADGTAPRLLQELIDLRDSPVVGPARIALGRYRRDAEGFFEATLFRKGLEGIESRVVVETLDLDIEGLIEEIDRQGRRSEAPADLLAVAGLLEQLRRLYPERRALAVSLSELTLSAARGLSERRWKRLAGGEPAAAAADRAQAAGLYRRSAELQRELAGGAGLADYEVEGHLRAQANRLYEGGLYAQAARVYQELFARRPSVRFDKLMAGLALKQAGAVPDAHDVLAQFIGAFSDREFLKPNALLLQGEVLIEMGRYADAIAHFKRVQGVGRVGPAELDGFFSVVLQSTEGIRLDLLDPGAAPRGERTFWGESFLGIARAAYLWARRERRAAAADPAAEARRRLALEEGVRALEEQFRARYLEAYERGGGGPEEPPPADALSVYYLLGLLKLEQGRWSEAEEFLGRALGIGRTGLERLSAEEERMWRTAHTLYADAALVLGRFKQAADRYEVAIRRFAHRPETMFARLGLVKALLRAGETDRARAQLQEARREYERMRPMLPAEAREELSPLGMSVGRWDLELAGLARELK
jgi:tetratricopeptide (TPR) repeat protein